MSSIKKAEVAKQQFRVYILDFAYRFPELVNMRSCDILTSSWISIAWYLIYRIPTGQTLKVLDACFLRCDFSSVHFCCTGFAIYKSFMKDKISVSVYYSSDEKQTMKTKSFGLLSFRL